MAESPRPIAVLVDREGLGDVMLKTPFLRALRHAFPDNEVWWIATHQSSMADELRPMFRHDVAKVITQAGLKGPTREVLRRLRALPPFERVFDARTKVSIVALARYGLTHNGFYCCLPGYILCDGKPPAGRQRPKHIAARMLSLVACATGKPSDPSGRLEASPESQALARELLPDGPTYLGIAPGSREAIKNWPMERFCEVARALIARGVTPVFFLGPMESEVRAQIESSAAGALVIQAAPDAPPGQGLDRLIAQGQRLAALLANDNGVGHLLGASGVPVISLFGPTDPARWGPVAPVNRFIRAQDFGGSLAMSAIPAEAVVRAVMEMLGRQS
jgi:ADP-heptose:LPS heptosyltransferase